MNTTARRAHTVLTVSEAIAGACGALLILISVAQLTNITRYLPRRRRPVTIPRTSASGCQSWCPCDCGRSSCGCHSE